MPGGSKGSIFQEVQCPQCCIASGITLEGVIFGAISEINNCNQSTNQPNQSTNYSTNQNPINHTNSSNNNSNELTNNYHVNSINPDSVLECPASSQPSIEQDQELISPSQPSQSSQSSQPSQSSQLSQPQHQQNEFFPFCSMEEALLSRLFFQETDMNGLTTIFNSGR